MPGTGFESDADPQDQAEALDETAYDDDVGEMRTFEELPDVFDVTSRLGDRDDYEGLDAFDETAIDQDQELEEDDELHYRATTEEEDDDLYDDGRPLAARFDEDALDDRSLVEGLDEEVADAGLVTGGEDDFTNFQSKRVSDEDLVRMGYADPRGEPEISEDEP
jgi:hypothetical protein